MIRDGERDEIYDLHEDSELHIHDLWTMWPGQRTCDCWTF